MALGMWFVVCSSYVKACANLSDDFCVFVCGGWCVGVVELVVLLSVMGCEWLAGVVSDSVVTILCTGVGVFWFCGWLSVEEW